MSQPGPLDSLPSYMPRIQVRQLVAAPRPYPGPSEVRRTGAVLLVDLSGFTAIAEDLAARGPLGAEQLSEILDAFLGRVSERIVEAGGDVLLFAGDAALGAWLGEDDLALATRRAAHCALAIQAEKLLVDAGPLELRWRSAVGAGSLGVLALGGVEGRWHWLFAGDAIRQLDAANRTARAGEVVLSPAAWRLLEAGARADVAWSGEAKLREVSEPVPPPAAEPPVSAPDLTEVLRGHVPRLVLDRLEAGQAPWLAELRSATVVFINFYAVDVDGPDALSQLQPAVEAMQHCVTRYEGSLYRLQMDEKGLSAIVAFGLPRRAHEDDAERALNLALALRDTLERLSIRTSIGIASGTIFSGICGTETRLQYSIVGSPINLACRLMEVATDDIVCDGQTARRLGRRLALEQLPQISVKGRVEPVEIFRPIGKIEARTTASARPLQGREVEQRLLAEKLRALRAGTGGVVHLHGEAGIGKSRLLTHLVERARIEDVRALFGEGDAVETSTPYYVWRSVLRQLIDPAGDADAGTLEREILLWLEGDETLCSWAPLLNEVLPIDLPGSPETSQMSSTARADSLRELVVRLLERQARRRRTLLVLDDAHWFDSNSLALLLAVMHRLPALLIVVSSRPLESSPSQGMEQLFAEPKATRLELDVLSDADLLDLVSQRLGVEGLPDAVERFVCERAEGHPFHGEELAVALRDAKFLVIENGACRLEPEADDLGSLSVPTSLQGLITSRIDRLPDDEQLTLKVASVIGRSFSLRMLEAIHPVAEHRSRLAQHIQSLQERGFLRSEADAEEAELGFKHVITRDVAYDLLVFSQRRPLHRRAAEWLEAESEGDRARLAALLAHHWEQAGDMGKTLEYLEQAGDLALRSFSNLEAQSFLRRASELADRHGVAVEPERRSRWEHQLGEASIMLSDHYAARRHLGRALALRGRRAPSSRPAVALGLASEVLRQVLHRSFPERRLRPSPAALERLRVEASVYERLGEVGYFQNDLLAMTHGCVRSLNAAEAASASREMLVGYGAVSIICGVVGLQRAARFYREQVLRLAAGADNLAAASFSRQLAAIHSIHVGDWDLTDELCEAASTGFARLGDRFRWENCRVVKGFGLLGTGAFQRAHEAFGEALTSNRPDGAIQVPIWGYAGQLASLMPRGQRHVTSLPELEQILGQRLNPTEAILGHGQLALARLRRGEQALALGQADRALGIATQISPAGYLLMWPLSSVAEVYLGLLESGGQLEESARRELPRKAAAACRALRGLARRVPMAGPRSELLSGLRAWHAGRRRAARRCFERSAASAARLGMPHEEALAHYEIGRHLPPSDPERAAHLARSSQIFDRLDARYDLDRARRAMEDG